MNAEPEIITSKIRFIDMGNHSESCFFNFAPSRLCVRLINPRNLRIHLRNINSRRNTSACSSLPQRTKQSPYNPRGTKQFNDIQVFQHRIESTKRTKFTNNFYIFLFAPLVVKFSSIHPQSASPPSHPIFPGYPLFSTSRKTASPLPAQSP